MISYAQFHDGQMEGLWLQRDWLHVFLSNAEEIRFAISLRGIVALTAGAFHKQNIIFDVQIKDPEEVTLQDVRDVYEIPPIPGEDREASLLKNIREKRLVYLLIDPSCGANCLALAQSAELIPRQQWEERFLLG